VPNLSYFLNFFMIRKGMMAGAELKRAAGTVTKRLSKWLADKGYIQEEDAAQGAEEGADAARTLTASDHQ